MTNLTATIINTENAEIEYTASSQDETELLQRAFEFLAEATGDTIEELKEKNWNWAGEVKPENWTGSILATSRYKLEIWETPEQDNTKAKSVKAVGVRPISIANDKQNITYYPKVEWYSAFIEISDNQFLKPARKIYLQDTDRLEIETEAVGNYAGAEYNPNDPKHLECLIREYNELKTANKSLFYINRNTKKRKLIAHVTKGDLI